jgi:hypothetical protein
MQSPPFSSDYGPVPVSPDLMIQSSKQVFALKVMNDEAIIANGDGE